MRHKDFGQPTGINLSFGDLRVSTTLPEESKIIQKLQNDNKSFLDPWRTVMDTDSSETKIFSIRYKNELVGQVILWNFEESSIKSCSISYWLTQEYSNRGIGTSAVNLVCDYALNELDVDEIDATIQPENEASIRVIEKLPFPHRKMVGEQKVIKGKWQGFVVYTITKKQPEY